MTTSVMRSPAVAGTFYPSNRLQLEQAVHRYLDAAEVHPAPERVSAIVVPHAGYRYSAATAAHAYKRVLGKKPARVILVGCSHHYRISKCSVITRGTWQTPAGDIPIDEAFADRIVAEFGNSTLEAHGPEHSLEVQLPFLRAVLKQAPIVPVLFGSPCSPWHAEMGARLAEMTSDNDLMVVSTDLSHYLTESEANTIDHRSIDTLLMQNWKTYAEGIAHETCSMCGATAVVCGMTYALAKGANEWALLDYRTSAAASGDTSRVVGYAAISMERAA
jgi:AmmeMemoRadiSam system protein B